MQDGALERWSAGDGPLHRRDARAKLVSLVVVLVALAVTHNMASFAAWAVVLAVVVLAASLPLPAVAARAGVVLPFAGVFALFAFIAGESGRAATLLVRSYLSTLAVVVVVATTTMPELFRGLRLLGAPRGFVLVLEFVYRFIFLVGGQAVRMRQAAEARQGPRRHRRSLFRAASGAVGVLFVSSYARAERVHRALLARGFRGDFPARRRVPFKVVDGMVVAAALAIAMAIGWR